MRRRNFVTAEELFKDAEETDAFANIQASVDAHFNSLIDPETLKKQRDWSLLSNQVVGAEV